MDNSKVGAYQAYILVVDDDLANLHILVGMLKEWNYQTRSALNAKMALQIAQIESPDLILLDPNIPELDGIETCERLKSDRALKDIPVIFLANHNGDLTGGSSFAPVARTISPSRSNVKSWQLESRTS